MGWLKRIVPVGAVAAAVVATACSESTAPASVDATATATVVNSLNSTLSQNAVLQGLAALGNSSALGSAVARAAMAPLPVRGKVWTASAAEARDRLRALAARAPAAPLALFPANVLGKTFQWDTTSPAQYRITDSTLVGAPTNGVKFILYQVDTATGNPSLPLAQSGYLTMTDASTPQANVLQLLLMVGSQTAASYAITEVRTTSSLSLTAVGSVSNVVTGGTPVVFNLQHVLSLSDSSLSTDYEASSNGATVSIVSTVSGAGGTPAFTMNWSVTKGGTVGIVGSGTDSSIDVQFQFNHTTVATASGPADSPTITLASGRTLTTADLLALASIFVGFEEIEYNLSLLFTPGLLVFG